MEFSEALNGRHSYRGRFTDAPVPETDLAKIVEAAIKAPSAVNWQTTSFVIVNQPELLQKIAAMAPENKGLSTCRAVIVVVMDGPEESPRPGLFFGLQDYAAAIENMLLAITALGYASVWSEGILHHDEDRNARLSGELLGVPEPKKLCALLPVGVPAEPVVEHERKPFDQRAHWNHWSS
jgi:nitroreductase